MMLLEMCAKPRGQPESSRDSEERLPFLCFRCGVCCSGYQVQMNLAEARELADRLGVAWGLFSAEYLDHRWPGHDTVVIRHDNFRCLFLDQPAGSAFGLCRIHRFKPLACQAWRASPDRKECRLGLSRFWNLTVGEDGRLKGSAGDLKCFHTFVRSISTEEP